MIVCVGRLNLMRLGSCYTLDGIHTKSYFYEEKLHKTSATCQVEIIMILMILQRYY